MADITIKLDDNAARFYERGILSHDTEIDRSCDGALCRRAIVLRDERRDHWPSLQVRMSCSGNAIREGYPSTFGNFVAEQGVTCRR